CGKTTLLRIIAGFEAPSAGEILLKGQPICHLPTEKRGIGMVFQDYALFPHLTVAKNLEFGLKNARQSAADAFPAQSYPAQSFPVQSFPAERVKTVLELVGLAGYETRYPHELSGGQQQRIALARALAPSPALVLLDEPMSNLDVQVRLRLRQELRDILKRAGTSAIFVTHDQEEALSMADRVAVLNQGTVQQVGPPEEIYQHPATRFVADFVTQANFLQARFQGDHTWETELGPLWLDPSWVVNRGVVKVLDAIAPGTLAELMVRQEDFILRPDPQGRAVVGDRQFLGREHRYGVQLASGAVLLVRSPSALGLQPGQRVSPELTGEQRIFMPEGATIL
ncbi:MAG: ABC transporter ATP-binding protein, partial [Synechococcales cyanobacterium RU_4_20]|nr:ABC transporter ATP-binding protein [Synechococcales cyanobacterium RU_4_20]